MFSVLITAFAPYDRWQENSSWLALVELIRDLPPGHKVVTRRYPVDFEVARSRLYDDLATDYDLALHLGQAPGIGRVHLEAIGVNVGGHSSQMPDQFQQLVPGGPAAYQTSLPLAEWAALVRASGIPCQVSYHAGTYLCNAVLYLSQHIAREQNLKTQATFIHLPLAPSQVIGERQDWPTLPPATCAAAVRTILQALVL
ncbi:MAG TPA: pyroglutamyl-peptidase I [Pirellulaceae bacterium]|nr:pyroglutamyl-peptidase I [Pirellulaceae bacterium]